MARPIDKKCLKCAFTTFECGKRPRCYHPERCKRRRSYYRNRDAAKSRMLAKYRQRTGR